MEALIDWSDSYGHYERNIPAVKELFKCLRDLEGQTCFADLLELQGLEDSSIDARRESDALASILHIVKTDLSEMGSTSMSSWKRVRRLEWLHGSQPEVLDHRAETDLRVLPMNLPRTSWVCNGWEDTC